ncbi:MAG: hypothetical protein ABWY80_00580 [Acidimicrobiia bacterium]
MFIQVITGKVTDAESFRRMGASWNTDVRPGAVGFLGSTEGTTADGRFVVMARFESKDAAAKNNDRPEQGEWYSKFESTVSDVQFHDCSTVFTMGDGDKDDAGFVQVMVGKVKDRAKFDALNDRLDEVEAAFKAWRDDVLGDVMAVHDDGLGYHDFIYFESEAAAREGEKKEPPADVVAIMGQMEAAADITEYLDLSDPVLT